jgi:hypothetical protein
MKKNLIRISRAFIVLGAGMAALAGISQSGAWLNAVSRVQDGATVNLEARHQGHFVNENIGDVPWTLAPAYAASAGSTVKYELTNTSYTPKNDKGGLDDYHCFLVDPKLEQDTFVTGVSVSPDNGKMVHHAILFRVEPENVSEAFELNQNGTGWTCFGGSGLGNRGNGNLNASELENPGANNGAWVGAWVPGAGRGNMPAGIGVPVKKGSLYVMQIHYNLANGTGTDRSSFELTYAPEGSKLQAIRNQNLIAPVELPCPDGLNTSECKRETTIKRKVAEVGQIASRQTTGALLLCKRSLSDYQKPVGDASSISTSCDRQVRADGTAYSVAGHMHLLGQQIKVELISEAGNKTLLNIPHWDFHWQGNYWFKTPVQVKKGDTLRVSCVYDNSKDNRPYVGSTPLEMRYITWGEGTSDEMCLGVVNITTK